MGDQLTKLQENLQRNLRRRLEAAGLSDRGLSLKAKRNGQRPLSDTTVKSIMNGTIPKVDTLKALADELGCTVNDLIADDEDLGANERPDYMGEKLSLEEQVLISRYRALPQHERQVLSLMFDAFMLRHSAAVTQPTPIDAQKGRR